MSEALKTLLTTERDGCPAESERRAAAEFVLACVEAADVADSVAGAADLAESLAAAAE